MRRNIKIGIGVISGAVLAAIGVSQCAPNEPPPGFVPCLLMRSPNDIIAGIAWRGPIDANWHAGVDWIVSRDANYVPENLGALMRHAQELLDTGWDGSHASRFIHPPVWLALADGVVLGSPSLRSRRAAVVWPTISGAVRDRYGQPIRGVKIVASDVLIAAHHQWRTYTDGNGYYAIQVPVWFATEPNTVLAWAGAMR